MSAGPLVAAPSLLGRLRSLAMTLNLEGAFVEMCTSSSDTDSQSTKRMGEQRTRTEEVKGVLEEVF